MLGLDVDGLADVLQGPLDHGLLHEQVRPVLEVDVVVGVEVDGLVIAVDGSVHLAKFYLGEGSIIVEEVISGVDRYSSVVHFNRFLELFGAQADIPIVPKENFVLGLQLDRSLVVPLRLIDAPHRQVRVPPVVEVARPRHQLHCLPILLDGLTVRSERLVRVGQDEVHLRTLQDGQLLLAPGNRLLVFALIVESLNAVDVSA